MIVWFVIIGLLGLGRDLRATGHPARAQPLLRHAAVALDPDAAFALLGAVVLAVTGAEALYADMGHFGARRSAAPGCGFVFPALLLNYFGQGALLLRNPELRDQSRSIISRPTGRCCRWWCSPRRRR